MPGESTRRKRQSNQNSEPLPTALSTPISPPIRLTICLQIARPSPVPPCFRVVDASSCENNLNRRSRRSSGMPMPRVADRESQANFL